MIKLLSFVAITWLLCPAADASPQRKTEFSVSPVVGKVFGYAKWIMELSFLVDPGVTETIKSELEYPLNSWYGGLEMRIGSGSAVFKDWSVRVSVSTNLDDPSKVMKDHDWIALPGVFSGKISYTESRVKMRSLQGAVEGQFTLARTKLVRFGLIVGVRYQHFNQKMYGITGWQLDTNLQPYYLDTLHNTLVLTYKVTLTMPNFGLFYRLCLNDASSAELRGAFVIPFVSDKDDHVLRNRIATASTSGLGFLGGIKIRYSAGAGSAKVKPFVELDGEILSVDAKPKQRIDWYGDDPITENIDDTGDWLTGIPHHLTSKQGYLTARVGLTF